MQRKVLNKDMLRARKRMFDAVRSFFDGRDFLEVDTPIAVPSGGMEVHLKAFETHFGENAAGPEKLFLHTSPEYAMKRLLAHDVGHIYQIARVFRDEPVSNTHSPEFTMLEFYRCPGPLEAIMDDLEALIKVIAEAVDGDWKPKGFERLSVREAFVRAGLVDPFAFEQTETFKKALPIRTHEDDTWDDVFHRAMMECVEPSFSKDIPTILFGYPASMAALARIDPNRPNQCLRFELYAGSLELANAFCELTCPIEQRARFEADQHNRRQLGRPVYPIDEAFLEDLAQISQASGIALGLDRLLMLCLGRAALHEVIPFAPSPEDD
jgi:elongation factor P--(R)-beta-lysine ligase